jgi:glycerol-3-phosphate dehydrogenase
MSEPLAAIDRAARQHFRKAVKAADFARQSGSVDVCVTCASSRHVQLMAEIIGARKPYPMIEEEPEHCAESMLSVVASLYKARAEIAKLKEMQK